MTIKTSGFLRITDIKNEYNKGYDLANYKGVSWYWNAYGNLGAFSTSNLNMKQFFGKSSQVIINLTISADTQNYDVKTSAGGTYVAGFTTINLTINSGIYVGSSSTGSYAMTVTGFTSGDTINIINNGFIIGAGGNGGNGGTGSGQSGRTAGSNGGNALYLNYPTKITNNGTIAGGGGGGAGGDGGQTYGSCLGGGSSFTGPAGGGGAGYTAGSAGSGSPSGSGGTRTAGGAGGSSNAGGNPGVKGVDQSVSGGAAGFYIVGVSNATFIAAGTLLGQVS